MVRILEILEKEAIREAEKWAKDIKIIHGEYPTVEEFLERKEMVFRDLCNKAYHELSKINYCNDH